MHELKEKSNRKSQAAASNMYNYRNIQQLSKILQDSQNTETPRGRGVNLWYNSCTVSLGYHCSWMGETIMNGGIMK